jgi:hypothetical protein
MNFILIISKIYSCRVSFVSWTIPEYRSKILYYYPYHWNNLVVCFHVFTSTYITKHSNMYYHTRNQMQGKQQKLWIGFIWKDYRMRKTKKKWKKTVWWSYNWWTSAEDFDWCWCEIFFLCVNAVHIPLCICTVYMKKKL